MGGIYGSMALGLSLIFGVMKIVNFFHGSLVMVGMFASFWVWKLLGLDPYLTVVIVCPLLFLGGYVFQNSVLLPLFKRERSFVIEPVTVLLLTSGVWLMLDNLALLFFGSDFRVVKSITTDVSFTIAGTMINVPRLVGFIAAVAVTIGLSLFISRTDTGRAIQATSQNRDAAALCGINIYRMYNLVFAIGSSVVGVAAAFIMPFYYVHPSVGVIFDIKSFIIVVLGGMGSIPGALVGGIIIGLVESVTAQFVTATYAAIASFAVFIAILVFRPQGLLGRELWM